VIVATFNVENLFERPRAMNLPQWSEGQPALDAAGEINALFNHRVYIAANRRRISICSASSACSPPARTIPSCAPSAVSSSNARATPNPASSPTAETTGRAGSTSTRSPSPTVPSARVIAEVNPDILVLVEVESRPALQHFHDKVLSPLLKKPYPYNMVIDGNDPRGIDVGILSRYRSKACAPITDRSSARANSYTFSRDCPEYYVELPSGRELLILPNHFASKGSDRTGARRREQATGVRKIYESLKKRFPLAVVAGDLNDHPQSGALDPLLKRTGLVDAMSLKQYRGEFPGTYQRATANEKIDYLLLSPALQRAVEAVDMCRKGFYAPTKWESFENIDAESRGRFQASDHHCVWAELDV
jgi:endonuclease/exonuclease/phosphatase family metal-dependent hydrolase